jgi:hypothetical protein
MDHLFLQVQLEETQHNVGLSGGGLHNLPNQEVSQTSPANIRVAFMLVFDIVHSIKFLTVLIAYPLSNMCHVVTCTMYMLNYQNLHGPPLSFALGFG